MQLVCRSRNLVAVLSVPHVEACWSHNTPFYVSTFVSGPLALMALHRVRCTLHPVRWQAHSSLLESRVALWLWPTPFAGPEPL